MGCLYCIEFPNGKKYIGVTKHTAKWRFKHHACNRRQTTLTRAIQKYGREKCKLTTLVVASDLMYLKKLEVLAIAIFQTMRPNGYNSTVGADGVIDPAGGSEAIRVARMRKTMATAEYIEKQREVQAVVWTTERRAARAAEIAAKWRDPEYRDKLTKAHSGKKQSPRSIQLRAAAHSKRWEEPGYRESRIAQMKAGWARRAERIAAQNADSR